MTTYEKGRPYLATVRGVENVVVGWDSMYWWSAVGDRHCHDPEEVTDIRPAWVVEGLEDQDPERLWTDARLPDAEPVALVPLSDLPPEWSDPERLAALSLYVSGTYRVLALACLHALGESVEEPLHPGEPPRDGNHVAIDLNHTAWVYLDARGKRGWRPMGRSAELQSWAAIEDEHGPFQVARWVEAGEDQ